MEKLALSDKQSTEIASAEVTLMDWSNKWPPKLVADIPEAREISRAALSERVPNSCAETRPEPILVFRVIFIVVVHVVGEFILENVERLA